MASASCSSTDARIPVTALLGEVDAGWAVATNTLSNERAGVASMYLQPAPHRSTACSRRPRVVGPDGTRAVDAPVARDELMARYIDVRNLEFLAKRRSGRR